MNENQLTPLTTDYLLELRRSLAAYTNGHNNLSCAAAAEIQDELDLIITELLRRQIQIDRMQEVARKLSKWSRLYPSV